MIHKSAYIKHVKEEKNGNEEAPTDQQFPSYALICN